MFTLACSLYSPGVHQPAHAHDDLQITIVLRGSLEERVADLVEHPSRARAWRWLHGAVPVRPFLRIVRCGVDGHHEFAVDHDDILDILAAISARFAVPTVGAADLLRQARLRQAARHIADADPTIATVAHASGFADESHLNREFSQVTGVPPARFRRLASAFEAQRPHQARAAEAGRRQVSRIQVSVSARV